MGDPTGRDDLDSGKEKLTEGWPGPSVGRDIVECFVSLRLRMLLTTMNRTLQSPAACQKSGIKAIKESNVFLFEIVIPSVGRLCTHDDDDGHGQDDRTE